MRRDLLAILSDGQFHSGEALGLMLGVSRMAVWKHMRALREGGIPVEVVRGQGYRLPACVELLDAKAILDGLDPGTREHLAGVDIFLEIDSTNTWLRQKALDGAPTGSVCVAEMQSAGRGRRNRRWVSPFAASLYLSLLWRSAAGAAELGGLSLAVGVAIVRSLRAFGIDTAGLKWPNDVLVDGAKLAGILIDVIGESTGPCSVIIGIGINVAMPEAAAAEIDQDWTDLWRTGTFPTRLAGRPDCMIGEKFERAGLHPFLEMAPARYHQGRQVNLRLPNESSRAGPAVDSAGHCWLTRSRTSAFASSEVESEVAHDALDVGNSSVKWAIERHGAWRRRRFFHDDEGSPARPAVPGMVCPRRGASRLPTSPAPAWNARLPSGLKRSGT
jgi:BirA family biotin operon repressor/biotin-[acetyl-CoA-carboxylase] ligase